jgi:radical SAM superfamily enzyme YgiQ (UPF0313 family)
MKVTFVYYDATKKTGNAGAFGISILSAILKKAGYKVSLIHLNSDISKKRFYKTLKEENADMYGFTAISLVYPTIKKYCKWLKEAFPRKFCVIGGLHAMLKPEECIEDFDAVCIGEGENCFLELVKKIEKNKSYYNVKNFWFKRKKSKNTEIIKNERLPLIEDIDNIPFPDRELWDYYALTDYKDGKRLTFMASRGCPYNCTYCFNHNIRELFPNKQKWCRFRDPKKIVQEIKEVLKRYPPLKGDTYTEIKFYDDTLIQNKEWFDRLCKEYLAANINIPLNINIRANELTEELVKKFKKIGIYRVEIGIESGNTFIRNKIMKRFMTNKQIFDAFRLCNEYGIQTSSFNILGMPFETIKMMLDTIKINVLAKSTWQYAFVFQPFPDTVSWNMCKEYGFLTDKINTSLFDDSPIACPYFNSEESKFIQLYFRKLIALYRLKLFWPIFDLFITKKLIPFGLLIQLSPILNWKEYIAEHHPNIAKQLRKWRFWKKQ